MDGLKLINPEFDLEFAGKQYKVHKANLEKVILYQARMVQLADAKDSSIDIKGAAYCLYLVIKDVDATVTEDWVLQNAPGDLSPFEIFDKLGFMSRQKAEMMRAILKGNASAQKKEETGTQSSQS